MELLGCELSGGFSAIATSQKVNHQEACFCAQGLSLMQFIPGEMQLAGMSLSRQLLISFCVNYISSNTYQNDVTIAACSRAVIVVE